MELSLTAVIGAINLVLIVLMAIHNHLNHTKLVGNDLWHLGVDLKEIKDEQVCMKKDVKTLSEDVSYLKGKLDAPLTVRKRKNLNKV